MKRFAIIGAAGYIAPRHMQAIRATGNTLVAAVDPNDSVGVIDSFFPNAHFFSEFERFDRHIDKVRRAGEPVDYVSVTSPNYLHDSHIRFSLRSGANVICEKPLVLNPHNIDGLLEIEADSGRRVNTILQLRLHPSIIKLREKIMASANTEKHEVELTYITSRGRWYLQSWKGAEIKSGGIATNIGVHFFDMLHYVFGVLEHNEVHLKTPTAAAGFLEYERARVRWFLSIDEEHLPENVRMNGQRTFRSISIDGQEVEFSDGFSDLHTFSYQEILAGRGFGLDANRTAIQTVADIRCSEICTSSERHHFLRSK